jgi:hypothetical protein
MSDLKLFRISAGKAREHAAPGVHFEKALHTEVEKHLEATARCSCSELVNDPLDDLLGLGGVDPALARRGEDGALGGVGQRVPSTTMTIRL